MPTCVNSSLYPILLKTRAEMYQENPALLCNLMHPMHLGHVIAWILHDCSKNLPNITEYDCFILGNIRRKLIRIFATNEADIMSEEFKAKLTGMLPIVMKQMLLYLRKEVQSSHNVWLEELEPALFGSIPAGHMAGSNSELPINIRFPLTGLEVFYRETNRHDLLEVLNNSSGKGFDAHVTRQLTQEEIGKTDEFIIICRMHDGRLGIFSKLKDFNDAVRCGIITKVKVVYTKAALDPQLPS